MVKVGNQGLDDRYIRLRSHRISHPVVSVYEDVMAKNKDTNHYECDQPER